MSDNELNAVKTGEPNLFDLNTVIVDALNKSRIIATREVCLQQHPFREGEVIALGEKYIYQGFDADAVSEAITDYILDREKVRAALIANFPQACDWVDLDNLQNDPTNPFIPDHEIDAFIDSLTAGR